MPTLTVNYLDEIRTVEFTAGKVIGEVILTSGFPLEQPCAGRGTCGKCKVLAEGALSYLDEIERKFLLKAEREANVRLACRARIIGDAQVTLTPVVVYSNKAFTQSNEFKTNDHPLGLAIDLGSTTVAAFIVSLKTGDVYAGSAVLNQQTIFGADVITRLSVAESEPVKLSALAQASIYQAIAALKLSKRVLARVERVHIVGNTAMHHLLMQYPVHTLVMLPFQPHDRSAIYDAGSFFSSLFPLQAKVSLAPLIDGFVGSDTTACLAHFRFDRPRGPVLAIDLGTNGEVMATNGHDILVASTAAGPAFEGVNISCGTRAVDGAIVDAQLDDGHLRLTTIGNRPPVGLTGSGLLSVVNMLKCAGVVDVSGRLIDDNHLIPVEEGEDGIAQVKFSLTVALTQMDIRELQKAKGAIRVATDIVLERLGIKPEDLRCVYLTGAFGSQLNTDAILGVGLIPNVDRARIKLSPNGAGLGAAMFLRDESLRIGEELAARTAHVELDLEPEFNLRFVESMGLE
ncbi:MAG: hypothetical protein A2Z71_11270 [Chloroflexi bacterium RBG_13_50_21]|nr:MAG: hypothetical protein A2Z71_11270 [Chloroflexi bacterium RBG_13_50_21]OGO65296.1 MAG: hypothetical protein A2030_04850 [Chloroflexi bacterium RBG_19FT_COMBO_50_10]